MLWEHRLSKNKMYSIEKDQPENRLVFFGGDEPQHLKLASL